jgi:nucleoside-diphosphate-sugar epimerase
MVYAPALNLIEDATISPQGDYGMNKSITEKLVRECLPDRHTILRISNIIGPNMRPHTFLGHASQTLAGRNEIILDIHENTLKEFIPIDQFSYALARAVESLPLGTFKIGSGVGTGVGDIASWVVEGLGRGKVVRAGSDRVGEFILNIERLTSAIGSFSRPIEIRPSCVEVGQSIRNG